MFTQRETATLLAALLYWREEMVPHGRTIMRPYFTAIGMARAKPLSGVEIDKLSERLRERPIK